LAHKTLANEKKKRNERIAFDGRREPQLLTKGQIDYAAKLTYLDVNNFSHHLSVEERVWRKKVRWTWTKSEHEYAPMAHRFIIHEASEEL